MTGADRFGALPDVPTVGEVGTPILISGDRGFVTFNDVPADRIEWFFELMQLVAEDEGFQERMEGFDVNARDADYVRDFRSQIVDQVVPLLEELGLTVG